MDNDQQIYAFGAYQPFVRNMKIFSLAKFQNPNTQRAVIHNICHAIGFAILLLSFALFMLSDMWYCIGHGFDLSEVVLPFAMIINSTQIGITYISIKWKIQLLDGTIASLGEIIEKRTYSIVEDCI